MGGDEPRAAAADVARISTRELSDCDRYPLIREFYGRISMGIDVTPLQDVPLAIEASTLILPGVKLSAASTTPVIWERRSDLLADGNDDFCISWGAGGYSFAHPGKPTLEIAPETACIMSFDRRWSIATMERSWKTSIQIERKQLADRVPALDDVAPDRIDRRRPEGSLLFDYHWSLTHLPVSAAMAPHVAGHLIDLVALALGPSIETRQTALCGGVRAARLLAIKRYITRNLHRSTLSARSAGRALGISERYIRSLFAAEQTSFSDYVTECRLDAIRHRLADSDEGSRPIADIVAELGFAEPSTFYRR